MPVTESVVLPPDLGGHAMEPPEKRQPTCLDQFERNTDQTNEALKKENIRLKDLVVRLSEAVIRLVIGKK